MAEKTTIEESLKELDAIVAKLESREISLEDSFALKNLPALQRNQIGRAHV